MAPETVAKRVMEFSPYRWVVIGSRFGQFEITAKLGEGGMDNGQRAIVAKSPRPAT